jgi:hypothetical protein
MRSPIERCIDHAFNAANQALTATITRQKRLLDEFFAAEQHRLTTLKQRFGNVHAGEIDTLMKRRKACAEIVSQTQVRLEQVRLIVIRH